MALRVGYVIADKADLSLNTAYAFLADFEDAPAGGQDPGDLCEVYAMLNLPGRLPIRRIDILSADLVPDPDLSIQPTPAEPLLDACGGHNW